MFHFCFVVILFSSVTKLLYAVLTCTLVLSVYYSSALVTFQLLHV